MADADRVIDRASLPRLLYVGDISVADTMAGEALLYRLLQFYPPDKLALICGVRPDMPKLPGAAYHHWGPAFPRLLYSRVAEEYILWRAWRYYEIPAHIAHIATMFKPEAILSISHVSGWLAGWQVASTRRIPVHLIAHDDFAYQSRFPHWSRAWAERRFGEAYRSAVGRFCISDTMAEIYRERFGAEGQVIFPTYKTDDAWKGVSPRVDSSRTALTFAYGGSLNTAAEIEQVVSFARALEARGHRLLAFTPQHSLVSERATAIGVKLDARAPIHSDALIECFREEADCLFLPQSMAPKQLPYVATAFPTKWADYSTLGLPVLVFAPHGSSSARFIAGNPGCAELVITDDATALDRAIARLESAGYRRGLAETLLRVGSDAFSPSVAWQRFASVVSNPSVAISA
ncbi:MAG: hypothetical protein ABI983_02835 [Acidobacteriota bacterium]